jgi:2,3-bisphosphoglycerate-dependent phosphoglycerate mutase
MNMAERMVTSRVRWIALTAIIVTVGVIVSIWLFCWSQTTVLLVRHADRADTQDALSAAGLIRAQELVHLMERASLQAIYHSEARRTEQTAQPLATALGLTPIQFPAADVQALVNHVLANHIGETVLVVGHSDTVAQIIAAFGGPQIPDIANNEFDNVSVLTLCRCSRWPAKLTTLQYGAVSP